METALFLALAALVPTIDVASSCHGQEKGLPNDQRAAVYGDCLQAERGALAELNQKWATFPVAARQPCAKLAQTFGSYVELLVCIEIRAGNGPNSTNGK